MARIPLDDAEAVRSQRGEPTWEMAQFFPHQGDWTIREYLDLEPEGRVEYDRGRLEFLPMPTEFHQDIVAFLYDAVRDYVRPRQLGKVYFCGLRVRTRRRKFREPDVSFLRQEKFSQRKGRYWESADLVVEVVSEDDPARDLVKKKREYAAAGIAEYWIADPRDLTLTIFTLDSGATEYRAAGRYAAGETARSVLLDGLAIDVTAAFTHE
ncbi:MAG: Uma2 family endonuclease [Planctomycetota bacterium]|nr:Uma2 family endonuclease [Planctomycetaceae bacterium]MDQ3331107.1 Uma2 family endonuclease [Planctomycetota bacterium]